MAELGHVICQSSALENGGKGICFVIKKQGSRYPAFVIRYQNTVYGYLNHCAHQGLPLDWKPGEFFDSEGRHLICATHDAWYEPDSGLCVAGPCVGARLTPSPTEEKNGLVTLQNNGDDIHLVTGNNEPADNQPE